MSRVENQTGTNEKNVKNEIERKLSGTVRGFLERHPNEPVFMLTPGGYVYLVPEQIGNLLAGEAVSGSPYSWRECVQIKAEELLQQMVDSLNHADGTWYVLTRLYEPEVIPARTSEEGMVCHV